MSMTVSIKLDRQGPTTTRASIRTHELLIDRPEAKGGDDKGPMGGELMLAAVGGCFLSNLYASAKAREADVGDVSVEVSGTLEGNPVKFTAMHLRISGGCEDRELFGKLVTIAERSCICANTLKDPVALSLEIA